MEFLQDSITKAYMVVLIGRNAFRPANLIFVSDKLFGFAIYIVSIKYYYLLGIFDVTNVSRRYI